MDTYASEYPDVVFDAEYKSFLEKFYRISDTPDAHREYASQFTADATLVMASKTAKGFHEILNLREGMWSKVASRAHHPLKVFPLGANSNEVMLYGTVDYLQKTGGKSSVEWAARGLLQKKDGEVKFSYYQVYLDTAAQNASK